MTRYFVMSLSILGAMAAVLVLAFMTRAWWLVFLLPVMLGMWAAWLIRQTGGLRP